MVKAELVSMTGFAAVRGQADGHVWDWEIRSVNGKSLDLRLRLPDWIEGLEAAVRAEAARFAARGNVTIALKVTRDGGVDAPRVNPAGLRAALDAVQAVRAGAEAAGLDLAPLTPAELLALKGVLDHGGEPGDPAPLRAALLDSLGGALAEFAAMRAAEGAALAQVIGGQLDRIGALVAAARAALEGRRADMARALADNLARVMANAHEADPQRVAQELALLAVKSDIAEELDRLDAHVAQARTLLSAQGPVGRKFDFLTQEFMREANTLCAKSGNAALTRIGLDLKTVIDQMREQVQNVE